MTTPVDRLAEALKDRYPLERQLGSGGMATVYLAEDLRHHRQVALKVLRPELSALLGAERFLKEIEVTANLQHPHLLPLFDSGEADGLLFYVMPYIAGESLREKLNREKQLGVDEAVRITTQVASALDHAHRKNVIHRDIKPENILLHEGQALIADFGIALAMRQAGGDRLTETGLSLGTPQYMSPEQATGDRVLDARSDVYSLACVLYEMLAGEPPHTGPTVQAVIAKVLAERPRSVSELRDTVPVHVAAVLDVALAKLPADRFASAAEFAGALTDPAATIGRVRSRGAASVGMNTWSRLTVSLAATCMVLALLAAWGWLAPREERRTSRVHFLPLSLSNPPWGQSLYSSGVQLAPGGSRLAYRSVRGDWHLLDLQVGTTRPLGVSALAVTFSPSGDSLAYTTSAYLQQLYLVELATGRTTQLTDSVAGKPVWTREGWIYVTKSPGVQRIRVSDGARETLVQPKDGDRWYARNAVPLPDERGIVYTRVPLSPRNLSMAEIVALNVRSGESRVLATGVDAALTPWGQLVVAQLDGSLMAAPLDLPSLTLAGPLRKVLDGLEIRQTAEVGASVSFGNDGSLLYVKSGPAPDDTVVIVGRDGRVARIMPTWGGVLQSLTHSEPDGRWASSVHRGQTTPNVFVTSVDAGEPRRLTFSEVLDYSPQFIPNSGDVAFISVRISAESPRNWDLYRVPFDGSDTAELILDRPGDVRVARFTRDGRWIVFCEASHIGQRDVVAHRFEPDSITVILVGTDAQECNPDVTPDARWLTYESDETGQTEVWVRPFSLGGTTRWQVSRNGGTSPRWSSSGRELFYVNAKRELVAVPVLGGGSFFFGSPRVLFALDERSSWTGETTSNDQEFIVIRAQREASGQVVLVQNSVELLRQQVGQ